MTDDEIMRLHCAALYLQDERGDLLCINDWLRGPAPAFWIGNTVDGVIWRFRADVAGATRRAIEILAAGEPAGATGPLPVHHGDYLALLDASQAVGGPVYWLAEPPPMADLPTRPLREGDEAYLRGDVLEAWIPDVPHQQPMTGALLEGRVVAVCASVRITPRAHEAGVEALPGYRRRGFASAAVGAWAGTVHHAGSMPLYSTTWDNLASRGVARRLGFQACGWEYRIG